MDWVAYSVLFDLPYVVNFEKRKVISKHFGVLAWSIFVFASQFEIIEYRPHIFIGVVSNFSTDCDCRFTETCNRIGEGFYCDPYWMTSDELPSPIFYLNIDITTVEKISSNQYFLGQLTYFIPVGFWVQTSTASKSSHDAPKKDRATIHIQNACSRGCFTWSGGVTFRHWKRDGAL